ncbi:hypothetical protein [Paludisphaera soli]|uniref:hypothetical protein n=1 Tax=Paludisphaera soli TaxID=2712865 RepID=UPI0013ED4D0F|nr:hypothetical protein [Paludisphaera soli]
MVKDDARWRRRKVAARFAVGAAILEERQLMTGVEMPLAPPGSPDRYNTVGALSDVLFVGDATYGDVPVKQITIYNNSAQTMYPFLYGPNTGQSTAGGYYDPIDDHNEEYRGYIGYAQAGVNYLGLLPGQSITVNVPLVFWDSGRAAVATDPADLLPTDPNTSKNSPITNPFFFFYKNIDGTDTERFVVDAAASSGGDGIVMFYHSEDPMAAVNPGADAPEQLLEFTIRDQDFLTKLSTPSNPIDPSQLVTLINYDVSYVDHLLLPVAMQATNVPVPNTNVKRDYGWIGAKQSYLQGPNSLQAAIANFTGNTPANGLGTYFGGRGWPTFFNPNYGPTNRGVGLRIPGGANILFASPLAGIRSSYSRPFGPNNHWMLSSGGTGPIQYALGGNFRAPNRAVVTNVPGVDNILQALTPGMAVTANGAPAGRVQSVSTATNTVFLAGAPNIPDGTPETFVFSNPASDPYASKLTNLWYSWAAYYQGLFNGVAPQTLAANIASDTDNSGDDYRVLTFTQNQPSLALGMQVTGAGITALTTIVKIETVNNVQTIYLSAPIPGVSAPTQAELTFTAPQPIAFADQATIIPLRFPPARQAYAKQFAATVYEVLSVFSTAPRKVPALPGSMEVVGNSIGGNVGFLPTALPTNYVNISADVRDLVKSALRGVPDFVQYGESLWYPPPSQPTGGQTYNVFNLDPYVWFIHSRLGLSGYGFSFDDDTADVGANGTSTLSIAIGGLKGLGNQVEWAPSAQWGTVGSLATITQGTGDLAGQSIISLQDPVVYNQIRPNDKANAVVGAYVWGPGIRPGTNLTQTAIIDQNQFVLSQNAPTSAGPVFLYFTGKDQPPLTRLRSSRP